MYDLIGDVDSAVGEVGPSFVSHRNLRGTAGSDRYERTGVRGMGRPGFIKRMRGNSLRKGKHDSKAHRPNATQQSVRGLRTHRSLHSPAEAVILGQLNSHIASCDL